MHRRQPPYLKYQHVFFGIARKKMNEILYSSILTKCTQNFAEIASIGFQVQCFTNRQSKVWIFIDVRREKNQMILVLVQNTIDCARQIEIIAPKIGY